jgi:hypothetical protein
VGAVLPEVDVMTRDEIIEMAREADLWVAGQDPYQEQIERFAALVEQRSNAWRPASDPPEDRRVVVVWRQFGLWDSAIWYAKAGVWENDYGEIRDVTHWRDVTPPSEGE